MSAHRKSRKISPMRPKSRESKWERIKRKNSVSMLNIKTETVKKFLNVFTDEYLADLVRKDEEKTILDPAIVMDMRHEAVRCPKEENSRNDEKTPNFREKQMEKICNHKKVIEINLIENELSKFRDEMSRKRPAKEKKVQIPDNPFVLLDNGEIFASLASTEEKTNSFYRKMIEAPLASSQIFEEVSKNPLEEVSELPREVTDWQDAKNSCVQFEDNVEVITYSKEASLATDSDTESLLDEEESYLGRNYPKDIFICEETTTTTKSYFTFHGATSSPSQESDCGSSTTHGSTESSTIFNQEDDLEASFLAQAMKTISKEEEKPKEAPETPGNELIIRQLLPEKRPEEKCEKTDQATEEVSPEKVKIISELFREHTEAYKEFREILLRKYFLKWVHYTTMEKITKCQSISRKDRIAKIDAYLRRIHDEKRRIHQEQQNPQETQKQKVASKEETILLAKKYRNKFKIQQDIIEFQKLKLERQERMIAELRLSKLSEEARNFKQDLKNELKQVAKTGDIRVRAKAKCLQIVSNLRDDDDEQKLAAYGSVIPRFLAQMQERALERNLRHERAKERRRQLELEREEEKQAQEAEKRREDEEAKKARIEALREKRRREKQEKIRREQERQTWLMNCRRANDFYRVHLLKLYGIGAFRKLLERKRTLENRAMAFRKRHRTRIYFRKWRSYTKSLWDRKHEKAEAFHVTFILRQAMRLWKGNHLMEKAKFLVATDWYEMRLNERFFSFWLTWTKQEQIVLEIKMKHAEAHYNWHLKWRSIEHWQRLHAILRMEKETEARIEIVDMK
uniref:Putative calponin similarity domain-containing protein n=1 Tax=Lutzomyia longipalpis TaxID=7200 RepID=A0A1B0CEG2_LUTLO